MVVLLNRVDLIDEGLVLFPERLGLLLQQVDLLVQVGYLVITLTRFVPELLDLSYAFLELVVELVSLLDSLSAFSFLDGEFLRKLGEPDLEEVEALSLFGELLLKVLDLLSLLLEELLVNKDCWLLLLVFRFLRMNLRG
jgi:hypothetical protein